MHANRRAGCSSFEPDFTGGQFSGNGAGGQVNGNGAAGLQQEMGLRAFLTSAGG